jgi:hypothetical protein
MLLPLPSLSPVRDRLLSTSKAPIDDVRGGGEIGGRTASSSHCGVGFIYGLLSTLCGVFERSSGDMLMTGLRGCGGEKSWGEPGPRVRRGGGGKPCWVGDT